MVIYKVVIWLFIELVYAQLINNIYRVIIWLFMELLYDNLINNIF